MYDGLYNFLYSETPPLPDVGQWLLLALNEKLPQIMVDILRARIIGLHHYLMLFIMLGFSVLFNSVEAPGLGLGARYIFTMGVGRLLRAIAFISTILPSARPWCASARFQVPPHPHRWAQKYYVPYAKDSSAVRHIIHHDIAYGMSRIFLLWCHRYCNPWANLSLLFQLLQENMMLTSYQTGARWTFLLIFCDLQLLKDLHRGTAFWRKLVAGAMT